MNAKVLGNNLAVITTITLDQLKKLEVEKPEALCLYEGEGKEKHMIFRVATGCTGCVKDIGITFDAETNNAPKLAMVNVDLTGKPEDVDVTEYVAKRYGKALKKLKALEAGFEGALDTVKAEAEELMGLIEVSL